MARHPSPIIALKQMSYLVLARKWRPQKFDDIAGQSHITRTLQNAIKTNRIAHAYLFTGVRGVGKTTAARILAKALNCETGPTPAPCNECQQCKEITAGNSIDVLEIDGASNRGIDEVRQIIENARYQPAMSRFKIYIIDEVHQVTKDAFNALLKTLEEPPPAVKFILATTEPHRLPETILSRCQRYDFRRIALREIMQRLEEIARKEGSKISDAALMLLAREADGSMRDAQSLLEQILACIPTGAAPTIDERAVEEILGLGQRRILYDLSGAVIQGDAKRCIEIVAALVAQGNDLTRLSRDLVEQFRNLLVALLLENAAPAVQGRARESVLDIPEQELADLSAQAKGETVENLLDYLNFMAAEDEEIGRSPNPRFALEAALIRLATLPKTLPVSELIDRLETLERKLSTGGESLPAPTRMPSGTAAPAENHAPPSADKNEAWKNFVAFVGKQKKFLGSHLESGFPLELAPGQLKIGVAERHHLSYLQDAENFLTLKTLAKQFFGADVAIGLTAAASAENLSNAQGEGGEAAPRSEDHGGVVDDVLRIFPGAVRTVRREKG